MDLPELPPGCALDPGWTDYAPGSRGHALKPAHQRATLELDVDEAERNAVADVLRVERIQLWRDLYQRALLVDELRIALTAVRRENAQLKRENAKLRRELSATA